MFGSRKLHRPAGHDRVARKSFQKRSSTTTMIFDQLAEKLEKAVKKMRGFDKITDKNIRASMKDIKKSLLDADVNFRVVKEIVKGIEKKAIGTEVVEGVSPGQMFVKIVHEELKEIMGSDQAPLVGKKERGGPSVILLAGLQGAGKTTAAAKLALYLQKEKLSVMMIACDVYRPAAIEQLETLGKLIEVPVFAQGTEAKPEDIVRDGIEAAKKKGIEAVIVDTAGRQVIDSNLMKELKDIKSVSKADETLLVVDAMTGQEAASLTRAFNDDIGITGAILTKLDGDTRGGAALSVKRVSGAPIKFIGTGEKVEKLEAFYPDRMASRILGMGDVLTLVEKAQETMSMKRAEEMTKKMMASKFDFDDFLAQTKMVSTMGSLGGVMKMLPGIGKISDDQLAGAEQKLKVAKSMIQSMTKKERKNPELLIVDRTSRSRLERIAKGAGRSVRDAQWLVSDFQKMRTVMSRMSNQMLGGKMGPGGVPGGRQGNTAGANRAQRRRSAKKKAIRGTASKGFGK